jgi:hypothetical protein
MHEDNPVRVISPGPGWKDAALSPSKLGSPPCKCDNITTAGYSTPLWTTGPAIAISLILLIVTSYLSFSRITSYRTEADQLRLHLELRTKQLDQKTRQLEKHRQEVLASHQEDLLTSLPFVKGLDRAAAVTSPVGQQLANLAAAAQHFDRIQARMAHILSYKHSLPVPDLVRSNVFTGNAARLRRVVRDLLAGKEVRLGVVGGSISW